MGRLMTETGENGMLLGRESGAEGQENDPNDFLGIFWAEAQQQSGGDGENGIYEASVGE